MNFLQLLIVAFFVFSVVKARDLRNKLETLYESLEQQNPCHDHHCDFPSQCITMPNTWCEDCQAIPMCVNFG
ncbi:hypothetical protein QR680_007898 [Steinernema hermaphroditum]|uniref:PSI domain-containing protein n=1 Tax=Steinernema hermaphroditum TaxID=289476 RepID=A0AA39IEK1_9BILA|nr:hypothetical protein QR680_007898 [Steinernema hermaphroditum]